ncbi:MAG: HAD-IB family phosphatase [Gammaproteobacteria bacterium]|nr:HAD-IB family phosphatase [Gammaproteobacteria bacterium]
MTHEWQLEAPLDAIILDCDGTLSAIEGIDILAEQNGVGPMVEALTQKAMGETGINLELYETRLELVKPSRQQLMDLAQAYYNAMSPDAMTVINAFQELDKEVFVISAGLNPAVMMFANLLGIDEERVFAVNVKFSQEGHYRDFDHEAPTTQTNGKRKIIKAIKDTYNHVMMVGDGLNDFEVHDLVTRFVGYGGAYYRQNIADRCHFYIKSKSLLSLLPLGLTEQEAENLPDKIWQVYAKALPELTSSDIIIRN